jgi:hypothetical protein
MMSHLCQSEDRESVCGQRVVRERGRERDREERQRDRCGRQREQKGEETNLLIVLY